MAQHISVEKGSEKLSPPNHTHRRSLSGGTSSGPLTTLQKLADDSEAVQGVTALQDMANAHYEASHVVQQKQNRLRPTLQMRGVAINDDAGLEREVYVMGAKAMQLLINPSASGAVIQLNKDKIVLSNAAKKHYNDHYDNDLPSSDAALLAFAKQNYDYFESLGGNEWIYELGSFETKSGDGEDRDRYWSIIIVEKDNDVSLIKHYGPSS